MHTAPDLLEAQNADLARYLDLHAGLSHLLPAPEERGRGDVFAVPHLDADARHRAEVNARFERVDVQIRTVFGLAGAIALATVIGGIFQTIGGVL